MINIRDSRAHRDGIECWCRPEIVQRGSIGAVAVAKLEHNDTLGAYLGTWAATYIWDSRWGKA